MAEMHTDFVSRNFLVKIFQEYIPLVLDKCARFDVLHRVL